MFKKCKIVKPSFSKEELFKMASAVRVLSADMVQKAKSGHPGAPLGQADVLTVLFANHLRFDVDSPNWFGRDRFVLSSGHASAGLYSLLYLVGYRDIFLSDLKKFRQLGSKTAGHPEVEKLDGVEMTTGPLGEGLASAVGLALAEKMARNKFDNGLVDNYTYVMMGDGCLMEGISEEAISFAGHHKLGKLIAFWDDNKITIDGATSLATSVDMEARFKANGWQVLTVDGHNCSQIDKAICKAKSCSDKPTMIVCKTDIGAFSHVVGSEKAHGAPLGEDGCKVLRENLGWKSSEAFEIPENIMKLWESTQAVYSCVVSDWNDKFKKSSLDFKRFVNKDEKFAMGKLSYAISDYKKKVADKDVATRQSFNNVLNSVHSVMHNLVGGSADLLPANKTFAKGMVPLCSDVNCKGNYIHYGIREHFMGACMNGLALYGFKPYGGTFFSFFDFVKPALRLSALMDLGTTYIFSHDSIGVGEDGPTHQPVEHLTALRAIPNVVDLRPCDEVETAECMEIAFNNQHKVSAIMLSRQGLPLLRKDRSMVSKSNLCKKGAYRIYGSEDDKPALVLMASGSEVSLCVEVAKSYEAEFSKKKVWVISLPSYNLFDEQSELYKSSLLPAKVKKVAIEASKGFEWFKYVDEVIGMDSFGKSAPAGDLFKKFGFSVDKIMAKLNN